MIDDFRCELEQEHRVKQAQINNQKSSIINRQSNQIGLAPEKLASFAKCFSFQGL
jgi:hypothetical protein